MKRALFAILLVTAAWGASWAAGQQDAREPHEPIRIVGDDGFESCTCVRGGSGTAEDPYRISDWRIDLTPYRHQAEMNGTKETTQRTEPHTVVGINFRNTSAHVVVDNVRVVDEGPGTEPYQERYQEETIGTKVINASNIHFRDVEFDGTYAGYSLEPGEHEDLVFEDTTFRSRVLTETDVQYFAGQAGEAVAEMGPDGFSDLYDEHIRGYVPRRGAQDHLTYRNVTAQLGLYSSEDDAGHIFDWGLYAENLTADNFTVEAIGEDYIAGSIYYGGNASIQNVAIDGSVGFYCLGGLCADVEIRGLDVDGHVALRHPDGAAFFRPDALQATVTDVHDVTTSGGLSLEGPYGLYDADLGSFLFLPPDEGQWREDVPAIPSYPVVNVTTDGYSTPSSTDGYNALRVDAPLHAENLHLEPGVELQDALDVDAPPPVFENSTAGGLPIVSLHEGEGPHRVEQTVAAATVESGAVVEQLHVDGQNEEVVPWLSLPFVSPHSHGVFIPHDNTTLRNVTIEAAATHALPLEGGVHAENITIIGKDLRDQAFRYSGEDVLSIAVDALEGPNTVDNLTVDGVPWWTLGMIARNPAHLTDGTNWRMEDVGAGVLRFCFRGTDICRHIDATDVRIDADAIGLWDVMPFFGIEAPHLPSEGPMEVSEFDISAPVPLSTTFNGRFSEGNLDVTHEAGVHLFVSQWSDVQLDGAWFDSGVPDVLCGNCRLTTALDHVQLENLQFTPFNEAPSLSLDAPTGTVPPGPIQLQADVGDDWDEAGTPAWSIDGDLVHEGHELEVSLDHGVHPASVSVPDHHGGESVAREDILVKSVDRPLAYVHPVGSPDPGQTVEVTGEGYGNVANLTWDVGDDGTVDGQGSTIEVTIDQRHLPIALTAEADDGHTHTHTRTVDARDDPPAPSIDLPATATVGETVTAQATGEDDWGIQHRAWRLLPLDENGTGPSFTFTPDTPGPLPVRLTTTDTAGQSNVTTDAVQVQESPSSLSITINPLSPTTADTIELAADNGADWRWDVGDDGTVESTGPALRWSFATPGTYVVNVSALVDGERTERRIELAVTNPDPDAAIAVEPGRAGAVQLTALVDDEGTTTTRWDVDGDGDTEFTGPSATWVPPAGTHTVTLTVVDDDGARTNATKAIQAPERDAGLTLDVEDPVATAPYETAVHPSLSAPVRADAWRADLDGDDAYEHNGSLPVPTTLEATVDDTGTTNVTVELLDGDRVVADAQRQLEGLAPGQTPPSLNVTASAPGPGHVVDEPLTVTVEATDEDGLDEGQVCTTECRTLDPSGTADTLELQLPTPPEGTPVTVQVEDVHDALNRTSQDLHAEPSQAPQLSVAGVTVPAGETFTIPTEARDPDGRPISLQWSAADRTGHGEPGPFQLPSGTQDVTVTASDPSGTATTVEATAVVDEVHQAQLALTDEDPRTGDELSFLAVVDDSHGPADDVDGELSLSWRPAPVGPSIPLGIWDVDEPRELIETDVRQRPGTIVANLTVQAGPSPDDPLPSRDEVSVELEVEDGGSTSSTARAMPGTGSLGQPTLPGLDTEEPEALSPRVTNATASDLVEALHSLPVR